MPPPRNENEIWWRSKKTLPWQLMKRSILKLIIRMLIYHVHSPTTLTWTIGAARRITTISLDRLTHDIRIMMRPYCNCSNVHKLNRVHLGRFTKVWENLGQWFWWLRLAVWLDDELGAQFALGIVLLHLVEAVEHLHLLNNIPIRHKVGFKLPFFGFHACSAHEEWTCFLPALIFIWFVLQFFVPSTHVWSWQDHSKSSIISSVGTNASTKEVSIMLLWT